MVDDTTTLAFPSQGSVTVPLTPPQTLICCMAAGPGGHALHVLIDTGTDPSAVDANLARRLVLPTGGSGLGQGAVSDMVQFTEAVLPWLRLGDLTIRNLFAPALDLSGLPFRVDVVLGYNVLRQLTLKIDYRRRVLVLAHPDLGPAAVAPTGTTLPLAFFEHFPALLEIEVEDHLLPLATIDTGSNAALTIGPDLAGTLGLLHGAHGVSLAQGAGFGGTTEIIQRHCRQIRVGPFVLHDITLDAHLGTGGDFGRSGRANIGNQLLSRFASVALDYERQIAVFEQ